MEEKLYAQYAAVKGQIAALTLQKTSIESDIKESMVASKQSKVVNDFGIFTVYDLTRWEYTETIKKMEDKVKLAKVKEQNKGDAKAKMSTALRFTPKKI